MLVIPITIFLTLLINNAVFGENNIEHSKRFLGTKVSRQTIFGRKFSYRDGSPDPAVNKKNAEIARYIVHHFDWAFMGSISVSDDILGSPFVSIQSYSDGTKRNSTGKLYFYLSPSEYAAQDLEANNKTMIGMTMDQDGYCRQRGWDVKNHKCHWVSISGTFRKLEKGTREYSDGYQFLLYRHPTISSWPADKNYFVATIDIFDVMVEAGKGEMECVPLPVYYETEPKNPHKIG